MLPEGSSAVTAVEFYYGVRGGGDSARAGDEGALSRGPVLTSSVAPASLTVPLQICQRQRGLTAKPKEALALSVTKRLGSYVQGKQGSVMRRRFMCNLITRLHSD
jgi:hypothetical protein